MNKLGCGKIGVTMLEEDITRFSGGSKINRKQTSNFPGCDKIDVRPSWKTCRYYQDVLK